MTALRDLTQVLEIIARHQANVATTLSLSEQVAMAGFQDAFAQMGETANNNTPSSAQRLVRDFAVNRNEAVYGLSNAIRPLDAQPITTSVFADSGRMIVHPAATFTLSRFDTNTTITKPRIRVRAGIAPQASNRKDNVIRHDFTRRQEDLGLVG